MAFLFGQFFMCNLDKFQTSDCEPAKEKKDYKGSHCAGKLSVMSTKRHYTNTQGKSIADYSLPPKKRKIFVENTTKTDAQPCLSYTTPIAAHFGVNNNKTLQGSISADVNTAIAYPISNLNSLANDKLSYKISKHGEKRLTRATATATNKTFTDLNRASIPSQSPVIDAAKQKLNSSPASNIPIDESTAKCPTTSSIQITDWSGASRFLSSDDCNTLHLHFCSFRRYRETRTAVLYQNAVFGQATGSTSNPIDTSRLASTNLPKMSEQSHVYCCKIELDDVERNMIEDILTRKHLFGSLQNSKSLQTNENVNYEKILKQSMHLESVYTLLSTKALELSFKFLQKIYILFLTYKCLIYNNYLKCYVIKECQWLIHVYLSEFYFYIMWKIELFKLFDLNKIEELFNRSNVKAVVDKTSKAEEQKVCDIQHDNVHNFERKKKPITMYKKLLIEELKHLCIILDLFEEINGTPKDTVIDYRLKGFMLYQVEKFRKHILDYLSNFHRKSAITSMYFLANNMKDFANKDGDKFRTLGMIPPKKTIGTKEVIDQTQGDRLSRKEYDTRYLVHHLRNYYVDYSRVSIFLFAFTTDFTCIDPPILDLDGIIANKSHKPRSSYKDILYKKIMENKVIYQRFEDSIIRLLQFITFVRQHHNQSYKIYGYDMQYFLENYKDVWDESEDKNNKFCAVDDRLVKYRRIVMHAMGFAR